MATGTATRQTAAPASTAEVAQVLREAYAQDRAVMPRGNATKLDWGVPPRRTDVVLDLRGVSGVVEHAAGDLVVVVRAGTPVAELQDVLATTGQQLALDSPLPGTVGGLVATAVSGPRRLLYGTVRDLLIGVTFVRADGVVAKAGGRVVKNVAGYDFGKLLSGSFGTLGVVTEAVFRLHPVPAARLVVSVRTADPATAGRLALAVVGSQLVPSAVELHLAEDPVGGVTVTCLFEGVATGVGERAQQAQRILGPTATVTEDLPDGFADLPYRGNDSGIGLKVTSSLSGVGPTLETTQRLAEQQGLALSGGGSAAGVLHFRLPADSEPGAVKSFVESLRGHQRRYDGGVVVLTAPPEVRGDVDMWGPVAGLELMRRLKQELDPKHLLSPGRFVGGI